MWRKHQLELENTLGFSFLGIPTSTMQVYSINFADLSSLGRIVHIACPLDMSGGLSLYFFLDDRAWTRPPPPLPYMQVPPIIPFPLTGSGSLEELFGLILQSVPVPSLGDWVDEVWNIILPQVPSYHLIILKDNLEDMIRIWLSKNYRIRRNILVTI